MASLIWKFLKILRKSKLTKNFIDTLIWQNNDFWRRFDHLRANLEHRLDRKPKIHPFNIYYIDPKSVNRRSECSKFKSFRLSPVIGGDWDQKHNFLENYDITYSLNNYFNHNKDWVETDFYTRAKKSIKEDKEWQGREKIKTLEQLKMYLDRIESLYNNIKSNGYKKQSQIRKSKRHHVPTLLAYERHEVTVNIGRDGEFLLEDGWHRLAIAKALDLNRIPVRVKVRHKKWQEKRKETLKTGKPPIEKHPDLINI